MHDYTAFKPLLLAEDDAPRLASAAYRRFILAAVVEPGIRLLLHRHGHVTPPDWPYIDTKFNPNTGAETPNYRVLYAWFLGRGTEALAAHLAVLETLEGLTDAEKAAARELFARLIDRMAATIVEIAGRNRGRVPFRVNRDLLGIDERGRPEPANPEQAGAGDVFCAKGLLAAGTAASVRAGVDMLLAAVAKIRQDRFGSEQFSKPSPYVGQGMRMLLQGAVSLAARPALAPAARQQVFDCAAEFAGDVLHRHWDAAAGVFAENTDRRTGARQELLDPGHAIEFAGLGLSAARCLQADAAAAARHAGLLAEARREMPRILSSAFATGWNRRHPGLLKAVHNRTGAPIIDQMPWWNLPETMRAAAYAAAGAVDEGERDRHGAILIRCHNTYFTHYPNRNYFLFPYQTLDGATGRVLDVAPAVPEGDPLYHANLSLLEMLDVLGGQGG